MIKILKMLEDPDSDNDELNARIWCWERNYRLLEFDPGSPMIDFDGASIEYPHTVYHHHACEIPYYTTSLDAAISIGAEELEGWLLNIEQSDSGFVAQLTYERMVGDNTWFAFDNETMPRAICHARLQAREYVRKNHD